MELPPQEKISSCLNCKAPLSLEDHFCAACGQKRTTGRISIKQLFADFFDNIFNLDSRIFLTLRYLFVPGKLTLEYFRGKHKSYVHPFRIFLIAVIAMIAMINWALNEGINKEGDLLLRVSKARIEKNMIEEVDSLNQLYGSAAEHSLGTQLDSLKQEVYRKNGIKGDSIDLDAYFTIGSEDFRPVHIDDVFTLSTEELIEGYGITDWKQQYIFRQRMKILRDSRAFFRFLVGRLSWMALILIPVLALCLKLFYWKSSYYYVEHFIFSLHGHTVFFFLIAFTIPFAKWFSPAVLAVPLVLSTAFVLLSMKRFYHQQWWVTILKFIGLFLILYSFCILISLIIAMLLGIFLF